MSNGDGKASDYGPLYLGLSSVMGFTFASAAAMLAFYFAFQGALITNFSSLSEALVGKYFVWSPYPIPIGKIALSILCLAACLFNWWSYHIVELFSEYYAAFLKVGASIEEQKDASSFGLYSKMKSVYETGSSRANVFRYTKLFFGAVFFVWIGFGLSAWV